MQISLVTLAALLVIVGAMSSNNAGSIPSSSATPTASASAEISTEEETPLPKVQGVEEEEVQVDEEVSGILADYIYPESQIVTNLPASVVLLSGDDADLITEWYKQKIREQGFTAKNFVQTSVNGKVHNEMAASDGNIEISVLITQSPGEDVRVELSLTD